MFVSVGKPDHGSTDFSQKAASFTYTAPPTGSTDSTPVVDNFDVTISDGNNGNARGTISIRIIDPTPAATPPSTHDVGIAATVGQLTTFDVLAELHDANSSATLTLVSASPDSSTPDATVDISGGSVLITPKAAGTLNITYTVRDADTGLKAIGRLRVTIADAPPVNPPPVAVADSLTVASGGSNSVDLLANDLGITDPGDKATASLVNRPPASFGTVDLTNGVLTLTAGPGGSGGQAVIRYSLDDGSGQTSTATVTLTILACSESAPQVLPARLFTPYQTPIAIDLNQYVVSGSIVPGSVSGAGLTGPIGTFTPPAGMNGAVQVTYTVTNGCHEIDHGLLTIDVNRAPVGGDITRNLARGDSLTLAASDLASDDEPLSITAINGNPPWVTLVGAGHHQRFAVERRRQWHVHVHRPGRRPGRPDGDGDDPPVDQQPPPDCHRRRVLHPVLAAHVRPDRQRLRFRAGTADRPARHAPRRRRRRTRHRPATLSPSPCLTACRPSATPSSTVAA